MKKTVVSAVSVMAGMLLAAGLFGKKAMESRKKIQSMSDKHLDLFLMMNQWVKVKQEGKNLASWLEKKGYHKIAIYGMHYAGETLLDELKGTGIQVAYGIDKRADDIYADIDIVSSEDTLDEVDAIVVTAVTFFEEVAEELKRKVDCPVLSLEDILYEI